MAPHSPPWLPISHPQLGVTPPSAQLERGLENLGQRFPVTADVPRDLNLRRSPNALPGARSARAAKVDPGSSGAALPGRSE
jgi:hypothetical protein